MNTAELLARLRDELRACDYKYNKYTVPTYNTPRGQRVLTLRAAIAWIEAREKEAK